jgi:hypothetical protein
MIHTPADRRSTVKRGACVSLLRRSQLSKFGWEHGFVLVDVYDSGYPKPDQLMFLSTRSPALVLDWSRHRVGRALRVRALVHTRMKGLAAAMREGTDRPLNPDVVALAL